MKFVTRSEIMAKIEAPEFLEVEIEELGGMVKVRKLTGGEQLAYEKEVVEAAKKNPGGFFSKTHELLTKTICGEDGQPLFPGDQGVQDIAKLPEVVVAKLNIAHNFANRVPKLDEFVSNLEKITGGESIFDSVKVSE